MFKSVSFLILISALATLTATAKSRMEIRNFLEGFTEKELNGRTIKVQGYDDYSPGRFIRFHRGMGVENPSLVELLSLAYGAMHAIQERIFESQKELATASDPMERLELETTIRRGHTQDWIAWNLMGELVRRSLLEFDLRGFAQKPSNQHILNHAPTNWDEARDRDRVLKEYVLDAAKELYLGTIRFISLKQRPAAWLDAEPFAQRKPEAIAYFLSEHPPIPIPIYENSEVLSQATAIANGYKRILNIEDENSPVWRINLSNPDPQVKRELARLILGTDVGVHTVGLVTYYLHAVGAIADQFNVNTHDSFELTRGALLILFRHVIDMDAHASWREEAQGLDLLRRAADYPPLKKILDQVQARRFEIFLAETKTGPKLNGNADERYRKEEFTVYHGDLLKDLFGHDWSHYNWPVDKAYEGDPSKDLRLKTSVEGEGRLSDGSPHPKSKRIKAGDVWGELGTGVGSLLIALATQPAPPKKTASNFIQRSSIWSVAKEKLYNRWMGAVEITTRGLAKVGLSNLGDTVISAVGVTRPGAGVDYNSISHLGMVDTYGVEEYPEFGRADFSDAFPNRMRQAWRAHGFGFSHSRKGVVFALRPAFMSEYVQNFESTKSALEAEILGLYAGLDADWKADVDNGKAEYRCKHHFTDPATVAHFADYTIAASTFNERRDALRPTYQFCKKIWQRQGMDNFKEKILSRSQSDWDAEKFIEEAGKEVNGINYLIRNQLQGFAGFATSFDNHFDTMSKNSLYCSELVHFAWLRATGMQVLNETAFRGPIKTILANTPGNILTKLTGGFETVPYGANDDVFAPIDIYDSRFGADRWELVLDQRRGFFGVNDE